MTATMNWGIVTSDVPHHQSRELVSPFITNAEKRPNRRKEEEKGRKKRRRSRRRKGRSGATERKTNKKLIQELCKTSNRCRIPLRLVIIYSSPIHSCHHLSTQTHTPPYPLNPTRDHLASIQPPTLQCPKLHDDCAEVKQNPWYWQHWGG